MKLKKKKIFRVGPLRYPLNDGFIKIPKDITRGC